MIGEGEYLLLSKAPLFKRRYTIDGDLRIGCTIGCQFCYYRMIDTTAPYIGTGKLLDLVTPEEFVESVMNSKLIGPNSLVIIGARGDASMYPDMIEEVLEISESMGLENKFLMLRRAPFNEDVVHHLSFGNAFYGTTITPMAKTTGTPVSEDLQLKGLKVISDNDLIDRVSIEVGPITPTNITALKPILNGLKELGWDSAIYRGVSVGSWGIPREEIVKRLLKIGFITEEQAEKALKSDEYFYGVKNTVSETLDKMIREGFEEAGIKPYRYTAPFYAEKWGIPVALNRRNRVRSELLKYREPSDNAVKVAQVLDELGYNDFVIRYKGRKAFVSTEQPITEDVAMFVSEMTGYIIIAKNYMPSPDRAMLRFYLKNNLFGMPRRIKMKLQKEIGMRLEGCHLPA